MWIGTGVGKVLFVGVWKCGLELEFLRCLLVLCGNVDCNCGCEGFVCWCRVEIWIGTGVLKVFVGVEWKCGLELEL
jgi:hypothetical protein